MQDLFTKGFTPSDIQITLFDPDTCKKEKLSFRYTRHAFRRSCQRGISREIIALVLEYGEEVYKQGLVFHILGEKNIPEICSRERSRLMNTVVVVSGESNEVITCYRARAPYRKIRMKSKRLSKCR